MGMISASVLQVLHKFRHPVIEICGKESASRAKNKTNAFVFSAEAPPIFSKDSASRTLPVRLFFIGNVR